MAIEIGTIIFNGKVGDSCSHFFSSLLWNHVAEVNSTDVTNATG